MSIARLVPKSAKIDAATNNIPTAFSTGAGSKILTGLWGQGYTHMGIINETAGRICVISDPSASTAPSSSSTQRIYVPAGNSITVDDYPLFDTVYIQSDTGSALTTGTVEAFVW